MKASAAALRWKTLLVVLGPKLAYRMNSAEFHCDWMVSQKTDYSQEITVASEQLGVELVEDHA